MYDNPKINPELAQFIKNMEDRILLDSKQRHERRDRLTDANFKSLEARIESMKIMVGFIFVLAVAVVLVAFLS